jgi:hypothetical protein
MNRENQTLTDDEAVAERSFWVGVYPGATDVMTYIIGSMSYIIRLCG